MLTLSRFQRNAIMRAAAAAIAIPITVTPSLFSSRASLFSNTGVAPFSVLFHGYNTTDTETTYPFRDCAFVWNFGETTGNGAQSWGRGADSTRSRNWSYGPVAGHVFETPGTYTVTMQVTSAITGNIASVTTTIVVQDPDVVYAGKTFAISSSGNFTGAPTGTQLTQSSMNIQSHLADGTRFLFRSGETFTASALADLIALGSFNNVYVGTFGGTAQAILVNNTQVGGTGTFIPVFGGGNDCRFVNLAARCRNNLVTATIDDGAGGSGNILTVTAIQSAGTGAGSPLAIGDSIFPAVSFLTTNTPTPGPLPPNGVITGFLTGTGGVGTYTISVSALVPSTTYATGNYSSRGYQSVGSGVAYDVETKGWCTVLRCDFQGFASSIVLDGIGNAIQDCTASNHLGEVGIFPGAANTGQCAIYHVTNGTQFTYLGGNSFDRSNNGEHTARFQGNTFCRYESNYFKGANITKTLLATRGQVGASAPGNVSKLSYGCTISNNYFDLIGGLGISNVIEIQLHNNTFNEPSADYIIDHNYFSPYDWNASFYAPNNINSLCQGLTVRHNVMNFSSQMSTANNSAHRGVQLNGNSGGTGATPGADNTLVKNNSCYSSTSVREVLVVDANIVAGSIVTYPTNTVVENNVLYAPLSSGNSSGVQSGWMYSTANASGTKGVTINNTLDSQVKTADPLFTNPTNFAGFAFGAGSYALAAGMGINYSPAAV